VSNDPCTGKGKFDGECQKKITNLMLGTGVYSLKNYQEVNRIMTASIHNQGFTDLIKETCTNVPNSCDDALNIVCQTCNPGDNDKICGCYVGIKDPCNGSCNKPDTIQNNIDSKGNFQVCADTVCIIDNISFPPKTPTVIKQICNNCLDNECICIVRLSNFDTVILDSQCSKTICQKIEDDGTFTDIPCPSETVSAKGNVGLSVLIFLILLSITFALALIF
jgi:hypothetical protein